MAMLRISRCDHGHIWGLPRRPSVGVLQLLFKHPAAMDRLATVVDFFKAQPNMAYKPKPFIFICGGHKSPRRDDIHKYINNHHPNIHTFQAETIWDAVSRSGKSSLEIEQQLASLSDIIVIIVESPGSIAELGAFSSSRDLRKKLMLFIKEEHRDIDSFINTGPIRWTKEESPFEPVYYNENFILRSIKPMIRHIEDIERKFRKRYWHSHIIPESRRELLLAADVASLLGPIPYSDIKAVFSQLGEQTSDLPTRLHLASAVGLINKTHVDTQPFYYKPLQNGKLVPSFYYNEGDFMKTRARVISSFYKIDVFRKALSATVTRAA